MVKHLLSTQQFNESKDLEPYFLHADLMANPYKRFDTLYMLRGKMAGLVFLEPSTRTKISFDIAAKKLGCDTFSFDAPSSSLNKGESLQDTLKILEQYSDVLIIRNREHKVIDDFAKQSSVSVINAGSSEHPTQALTDLYTIKCELNKIHGTNILLMGDLKYNRSVFSLLNTLKLYKHIRVHLYCHDKLNLPIEHYHENIIFVEEKNIDKLLPKIDVVYVTRHQKELYPDGLYDEVKQQFQFSEKNLALLPKNAIIMHPLPKNDEIAAAVDSDQRAAYYRQAKNGLFIRMAILQEILKKEKEDE